MSRFDGLDLFLQQQQALVNQDTDLARVTVEQERADLDPLVRGCFGVLGDYYKTVLQPRTDLALVLKKKEAPITDPTKPARAHYTYIANFVPQSDLPYRFDPSRDTFYQPGEATDHEWHPNVALQFAMYVKDLYSQELKAAIGLEALVNISVWGIIPKTESALAVPGLYLGYGNGWNKDYSIFSLYGRKEQQSEAEGHVQAALTAATPNVLNHRRIIRGN